VDKKTLTIVLCQTRESEYTYNSLVDKVLVPMQSDLAFCGSAAGLSGDPILENAILSWNFPEPEDWSAACDLVSSNGSDWRDLCQYGDAFLGGAGYKSTVGSGLIIMYWREILRRNIDAQILAKYEWFIITRSDFNWVIKHPTWDQLDPSKIYFLNGEQNGGVSDRHIIFNTKVAEKVFSIADLIFHKSNEFSKYLDKQSVSELNPEQYLALALNLAGLGDQVEFIPYLGYAIRHETTQTRWSKGEYSRRFGYYVKYPAELRSCNFYKYILFNDRDWAQMLANKLGFVLRSRIVIASALDSLSQFKKMITRGIKRKLTSGHFRD
jgi:hypothetical protein